MTVFLPASEGLLADRAALGVGWRHDVEDGIATFAWSSHPDRPWRRLALWPTGYVRIDLPPLTRDCCEVCGLRLYADELVEVVEEGRPLAEEGEIGFGSIAATFCTEHDPARAPEAT